MNGQPILISTCSLIEKTILFQGAISQGSVESKEVPEKRVGCSNKKWRDRHVQ